MGSVKGNSLSIDLIPEGKLTFEQSETGIQVTYTRKTTKILGSLQTASLLFLNSFLSSCITIGVETSKPQELNWMEFTEKLFKMMKELPRGEEG